MKKHGCLWWLCIGWWWLPIKWIYYSIPVFLIRQIKKIISSRKTTQPITTKKQTTEPTSTETYRATGMSYRLDNLLSIAKENDDYHKTKKELIADDLTEQRIYEYNFFPWRVELVPEPDNPHDPNAIKVVVNGVHIAYIKAGSCSHLLKVIREGRVQKITCEIEGGKYKYLSCEYDDYGEEEYTMEKGEAPYSVVLHVTEK